MSEDQQKEKSEVISVRDLHNKTEKLILGKEEKNLAKLKQETIGIEEDNRDRDKLKMELMHYLKELRLRYNISNEEFPQKREILDYTDDNVLRELMKEAHEKEKYQKQTFTYKCLYFLTIGITAYIASLLLVGLHIVKALLMMSIFPPLFSLKNIVYWPKPTVIDDCKRIESYLSKDVFLDHDIFEIKKLIKRTRKRKIISKLAWFLNKYLIYFVTCLLCYFSLWHVKSWHEKPKRDEVDFASYHVVIISCNLSVFVTYSILSKTGNSQRRWLRSKNEKQMPSDLYIIPMIFKDYKIDMKNMFHWLQSKIKMMLR